MARTNRERSGHCEVRWATTGVEQPGLGTTVLGFVVVSGVRNASKITKRWTLRGLGVGTGSPPLGRPPKAQGVVRELADLRPKVRQVQLHSWGVHIAMVWGDGGRVTSQTSSAQASGWWQLTSWPPLEKSCFG